MSVIQYLAIAAACYCLFLLFAHFVKIVRLGAPKDLSEPSGSVKDGVVYANTKAMLPNEKESAFLHWPSYATGMLMHIGIFCSFLLFLLSFFPFFNNWLPETCWRFIIALPSAIGTICCILLFIRRATSEDLKPFSMPDDYISEVFVMLFQLLTTLKIIFSDSAAINILYYIICILLFIYMPLGKLRHVVYYFAARFHLGFFYGRRNVWPDKSKR